MDLYSYFRSSASFRVRIALALKGLPYDYRGVHLVRNEQLDAPYAEISPQRLVPLLKDGDATLTQARLALLAATRQVLRNGLALLGVGAPESMQRDTPARAEVAA